MFWIFPKTNILAYYNKKPILHGLLLVSILVNFPSIYTGNVQNKKLVLEGFPAKVNAGDALLIPSVFQISLDNKKLTILPGKKFSLAVVSVYSNDVVFLNHIKMQNTSWRENVKRWFRPSEIHWYKKSLIVQKQKLKHSKNLRLPSSVIKKLSEVDREKKMAEQKKVHDIVNSTQGELSTNCFQYPVHSKVVSKYGSPRRLPSGKKYYHTGLDLRAWYGTPIKAAAAGKVVLKEHMSSPGNNVIIDHGGGLYSRYMHFSKFGNIDLGQNIEVGQVIGYSGSTGRSQAPHLHWEIIWKGNHAAPGRFLQTWERICDPV